MYYQYKRKAFVLSLLSCFFLFGIMSFSGKRQPKHNFKVLPQDISRDSLHNIMHNFNISLGVKCDFCHAKSSVDTTKLDFASDDKRHKEIARNMMIMTADINKKYFSDPRFNKSGEQIVTCASCHHGNKHPENTVDTTQVN